MGRHLEPGDLQVGVTDAFLEHERPHAAPPNPPPAWLLKWEAKRPRWLVEMIAEAFGTFLFCWMGLGSNGQFATSVAAGIPGLGDLPAVGMCFGIGIVLSITFTAPISGGHLSPGMTIAFALFKGFPWRKVPHYILAQLIGAFIACLTVYAQYSPAMDAMAAKMEAAGQNIFTPVGPPGIIALFPPHDKMGIIFLNEMFATTMLSICIFCCLDPSNVFVSPGSTPALLGITFFVIVSCWAPNGVSLNSARDLGSRLAMACIYGRGVFPAKYSAYAALANLLATQIGALFQLVFLSDSMRPATAGALAAAEHFAEVEKGQMEREKANYAEKGSYSPKLTTNGTSKHVESV